MSHIIFSTKQYIFQAPCFIDNHLRAFKNQITTFIENKLTLHKLCCAIKIFNNFIENYKKHLGLMTPDELLIHVLDDTVIVPYNMRVILSDPVKVLLRDNFPSYVSDVCFVKFCVKYVYDKANSLNEMVMDLFRTCKSENKNNYDEIEAEFCRQHNLNACNMSEFILSAIRGIVENTVGLLTAYEQHCALPENKYRDLMIACGTLGVQNLEPYITTAPGDELDEVTCKNFAQAIDQCYDSQDCSFLQPERDISILFSHTRFSIKLIIFTINTHNGVSSLNACIYSSSQTRTA